MDRLAETVAVNTYHDMKQSEAALKGLLFKLFILISIMVVLIIVWKNPLLQFIISTLAILAIVVSVWYLINYTRGVKAANRLRRAQISPQMTPYSSKMHAQKPIYAGSPSKVEQIIEAIEKSDKHHAIKTEKELQHGISSFLKEKFPEYSISHKGQSSQPKLMVDDVELHLRVADKRKNLHEAVNKFALRKGSKNPAVVILDVGKVSDIDKYVSDLQKKGAKVVVLKRKKDNMS